MRAFCFIEVVVTFIVGSIFGFDYSDGISICLFLLAAWMLTRVIDSEEQ